MKATAFLSLFLLLFAAVVHAQIVTNGDYQPDKPFVYETVSFPNADACEQVTIQTKHPEQLAAIEFKATDRYLAESWSNGENTDGKFPMNFSVPPGKVKIRFKKKGEDWKLVEADLLKGKPLVINLENSCISSPNG